MKSAGLDVGRRFDKTSLIAIEDTIFSRGMQIGGLRFREQAEFLAPILRQYEHIFVDVTGLGIGLAEYIEDQGLKVVHVTIVPGNKIHIYSNLKISVGKEFLIYNLTSNISGMISELGQDIAIQLHKQLQNFVVKPGRKIKMEAKIGHDDLVLACGLALLGKIVNG